MKSYQANCSLHSNAMSFMLRTHEWMEGCFYVKHINYNKALVTVLLVKLNLTLRINCICPLNGCLGWGGGEVLVSCPAGVEKIRWEKIGIEWRWYLAWNTLAVYQKKKRSVAWVLPKSNWTVRAFIYSLFNFFSQPFKKIQR